MNKDLKIFANEKSLDQSAVDQVNELLNQDAFSSAKVRIMPDIHRGAGCVIGFTANLGDKVIPNVVGVDLGCGVSVHYLGKIDIDFKQLDKIIKRAIPTGFSVNEDLNHNEYEKVKEIIDTIKIVKSLHSYERLVFSMSSLGGGNHFIEVDEDDEGGKYLVIHTGSRNLGKQVADFYQKLAISNLNTISPEKKAEVIARLKAENRPQDISKELKALTPTVKIPDALAYLENEQRDDYLHDMRLCQQFAHNNRKFIAERIIVLMDWEVINNFESVHNYIGDDNIVRKGAISAYKDEQVIIPISMKDGCILGRGLGNEDWNYSGPHGAGRILSRTQARNQLTLEDFTNDMKDVYTTTADKSTIDESPRAYKPIEHILEFIKDTIIIDKIIKPVYNFKASDDN